MRSNRRLLLVLAVACGTCDCAKAPVSHIDEAVQAFSRQNSCPEDRLEVKHVAVPLSELIETNPPPEVAADAGRRAVWNQSIQSEIARYDQLTAVHVAGCGGEATFFCWYGHRIHRDHECLPVDLEDLDFTTMALKPSAGPSMRQLLGLPPPPPEPETHASEMSAEIAAEFHKREMEMRKRLDELNKQTSSAAPAPPPKNRP